MLEGSKLNEELLQCSHVVMSYSLQKMTLLKLKLFIASTKDPHYHKLKSEKRCVNKEITALPVPESKKSWSLLVLDIKIITILYVKHNNLLTMFKKTSILNNRFVLSEEDV